MSVGVPCLVTSEGASKEVVGETGLTILGIGEKAIAECFFEYLNYDDEKKLDMKKAALIRANEFFRFERRLEVFKQLLEDYALVRKN